MRLGIAARIWARLSTRMSAPLLARARRGDVGIAVANLFWLAIERLTQVAVVIVINGVLARYLGADMFGKWQYANTLLLVMAPITWVCGAEILVPTFVEAGVARPGGPPDKLLIGRIFGSAFALRMAVAIAAMLMIWIGVAVFQSDSLVTAMVLGLTATLVFREPFAVVTSWLAARTYSKPALLLSVITGLAKALAVFLLARAALAPSVFGWIWAVESALIAAGLTLYYRRYGHAVVPGMKPGMEPGMKAPPGLGWRVDKLLFKQFAGAGSVFWLGLICMYGFMKIDRLMLQHYVSFAELGRYAAAQQLNENWTTLALMLAQTVAPAFIYRISDTLQLRRNLWRLLLLTGAVMGLGALIIGIFAAWVIHLVFGPGFETAAVFLRYAAWLSVPAGLEAVCNLIVLKYQAKSVLLMKWLAALAAAFLSNLILIPAFGGRGALMSMAIGYTVAIAIDAVYIRNRLFRVETIDDKDNNKGDTVCPGAQDTDLIVEAAPSIQTAHEQAQNIVVLMPVYNCHQDAWRTIASFAETALPVVHILVIDDGSEPAFSASEHTIHGLLSLPAVTVDIIRMDENGGIERALAAGVNRLLRNPAVRYIARIDAGDLALPNRLTKQRQYLEEHPHIGALGMWARAVTPDGATAFIMQPPTNPRRIRQVRFAKSCFIHPAMMIRADALRQAGNYRNTYPAAEDLDLFLRIMRHHDCANLPEIGLVYEINPSGISATQRRQQVHSTLRLQCAYFELSNAYFWLGLGKNLLHLVMPYGLLYKLKRHIFNKGPVR